MSTTSLKGYNREIEGLIEAGRLDEAIAHCRHILKSFPKHVDTYRLLGRAFLEYQRLGDAADIFQRVLSSVPDDYVSHVGMSIIREDEGNLDAGIWHMERALDFQPSNASIQEELRRLYGKRDGVTPPKIRLSQASLARTYAQGHLVEQAIAELRSALANDPSRLDLQVLLARMYHENKQRVKATQTCSQVLNKLPYCLEANLILSEVLVETNRLQEAKKHQDRARELNPYIAFLTGEVLTPDAVPEGAVTLTKLEGESARSQSIQSGQPEWVASIGQKLETEPAQRKSYDLRTQSDQTEDLPEWMIPEEPIQISSPTASGAQDPIPEFMKQAGWRPRPPGIQEQPPPAWDQRIETPLIEGTNEPVPAELPDWLQALAVGQGSNVTSASAGSNAEDLSMSDEKELPDWLKGFEESEEAGRSEKPSGDELPDWLQELDAEGAQSPGVSSAGPSEPLPEWLKGLDDDERMETSGAIAVSEWLRELNDEPKKEAEPLQPVPPGSNRGFDAESTDPDLPDWLEGSLLDVPEVDIDAARSESEMFTGLGALEESVPDWLQESPPEMASAAPVAALQPESQQIPAGAGDSIEMFDLNDPDAALAFLESLALKHGVQEEQLFTDEEQRSQVKDALAWAESKAEQERERVSPPVAAVPEEEWLTSIPDIEEPEPIQESQLPSEDIPDWLLQTALSRRPVELEPVASQDVNTSDLIEEITPIDYEEELEMQPKWTPETSDYLEQAAEYVWTPVVPEEPATPEAAPMAAEEGRPQAARPKAAPAVPAVPAASSQIPVNQQVESWLAQAKVALAENRVKDALANYSRLIKKNVYLDRVIGDLVEVLEYQHPVNVEIWQTLGDAYAQNSRLQDALNAYTKAEELLR